MIGAMALDYESLKARHRAEREGQHQNLALRVHRALSWLKRAEQLGDDPDGRFIFLWVVFNAAYATEIDEKYRLSEQETFRNFIRKLVELDKKNRLVADEVQGHGTVDHTPVYVREVVKRALELSSTAIILVHNHPSGDPAPSRADIEMTKQIIDAARPLGVTVHDHIIVGRSGHTSFKAMRLI